MNTLANSVFPLSTIFAGRIFVVPEYQRGYAWEQDPHLADFISDLECLAPGKSHYTGTLVLHVQQQKLRDKGRNPFDIFHVVDGQQRLTTIVILLEVLRARFAALGEAAIAESIGVNYLSGIRDNGQRFNRLELNQDCRDFFAQAILEGQPWSSGPTIQSHQRLLEAYELFQSYCNSLTQAQLGEIHDKVTQDLKFGAYLVESNAELGVIFETMNDRGKLLSELEKVKNYLLYLGSKLNLDSSSLTGEINATWSHIFQRLMSCGLVASDDENQFLRAHWIMFSDCLAKNWDGCKSVKTRFALKEYQAKHRKLLGDLLGYVQSLRQAVVPFCDAHAPWHSDSFNSFPEPIRSETKRWSVKLRRTNVLAPFLPLFVAFRLKRKFLPQDYLDLVQLLEKFSFRVYKWAGYRSHAGQSRLFRLAYEFHRNEISVANVLIQIRHTALGYFANRTFANEFEPAPDNSFYYWGSLKYFLYEYEEHLAMGSHIELTWEQLEKTDSEKSIEHILPQNPEKGYWTQHFSAEERKRLTHALGNLCLTADNSSYGRKPFPEKRGNLKAHNPCYAQGKLFMERALARFDDWTPKRIENRTRLIRDWALERWHLDDSDMPADLALSSEDEEGDAKE